MKTVSVAISLALALGTCQQANVFDLMNPPPAPKRVKSSQLAASFDARFGRWQEAWKPYRDYPASPGFASNAKSAKHWSAKCGDKTCVPSRKKNGTK